jgi:hypothetical protein
MNAWSSFARDEVPALPGEKAWPTFDPVKPSAAIFGGADVVEVADFPRRHELTVWPSFLAGN